MNQIPTQLAKEVIEAGKKATERPWRYCHGNINDHWEMWNQETATWIIQDNAGVEPSTDNLEYIVTSANHAEKLARICLVYEEALKEIEELYGDEYKWGVARKSYTAAEKIARDER